jgi:hypothetical protein
MFPKDAIPLARKTNDIQEDVMMEIVDEIFTILGDD